MNREIVVALAPDGALTLHDEGFVWPEGVARQALPVSGGAIVTDVGTPERGIGAVIDDVVAASWWVPFVFGEAAASALAELDTERGPQTRSVDADIPADADLGDTALRLLAGFWMRRWWPPRVRDATVTEWLLDVELGTLAAEAEVLFGDHRIAAGLLAPHLETLASEAAAAVAGDAQSLDRVRVVREAVLAAADVVDADTAGYARIDDAAAQLADTVPLAPEPPASESAPLPPALPARGEGSPVDWTSVHPRQLSPAEDAIRVGTHREGARDVVEVTVSAPAEWVSVPVEPGELYARIVLEDEVAAIALVAVPDGFRGTAAVDAARGATVSVYSDVYGTGARDALPPAEVEAVRAEVRAIVEQRLAAAGGAVPVPFAFERQLVRDALRAADIDETVRAAMSATDFDFDLEVMRLSAELQRTRSDAEDAAVDAFAAETDELRVDLSPGDRGWQVRLTSYGAEGDFEISILFASGAVASVQVSLEQDMDAAAFATVDDNHDAPVRVLIRRRA